MGYIKHEAVIVVTSGYRDGGLPDMDAFRDTIPDNLRHLVIGPIKSAVNDYVSYAFMPDGSKEYWDTSDAADKAREQFKDLFRFVYSDGSSPDDWAHVVIGDEEDHTNRVVEQHPAADRRVQ